MPGTKLYRHRTNEGVYTYRRNEDKEGSSLDDNRLYIAELLSTGMKVSPEHLRDEVKPKLETLALDASDKVAVVKMLLSPYEQPRMTKLALIFNKLFPEITEAVRASHSETSEPLEWTKSAEMAIDKIGIEGLKDSIRRDMVQCAMTYYLLNEVDRIEDLERWSEVGGMK